MSKLDGRRWSIAFRPTFLFVVAFALSITPHEVVHGITSYLLGFNSTLFPMWVNPDMAAANPRQLATIAASGPLFSLAVGILFWFVYRRFPRRPSGLLYLMLSMVGIYSFLGPLVGASLGGDFNTASRFLGLPDAVRYAGTAAGLILLPVFMFRMGTELLRWAPREFGRVAATACVALAPWVVGTALTLAIYWPLPAALVSSTLTGSAFWAFAALGAACTFSPARLGDEPSGITRSDLIVAVIAFAGVRLLVNGIRLAH